MAEPTETSRAFRASRVVRVWFGLVGALIGGMLLVGLAAGPAVAAGLSAMGVGPSTGHVMTAAAPAAAPPGTTPPGPTTDFNQGNKAADSALAKQKLIMVGASIVLLAIVYFGHKAKYKHLWRLRKAQKS